MLHRIIRFSIEHKPVIILFVAGIIASGIYSFSKLPVDAVPDITNNQVQIITLVPSQSALDIERLVTYPVEQTMSNIPGIEEVRSLSRFGLSVVTVVFEESVDVYWARQQVSERLAEVRDRIPPDLGTPGMAPVTTGLGEIYQYIIRPKKGYEDQYTLSELRTIQDWMVRNQLQGVPGVADVSSFGGYLRQYQISVDPDRLRSYNLGLADIFQSLQRNNQNTGGAYIDKSPHAWFIRSEGLIGSTEDIEKIVVGHAQDGIPILIRNVATVEEGHANRYGAMTYNAEGEVTGAIVMMLKGENSNAVVRRVKARMALIEKTLPEGVEIAVFLDRSQLVDRAIGTVKANLVEGALIVIFVLVVFLGNLRAGLIVASVIPLSMLFAVTLMQLFGVSGNLMSLGAIDFGLIVDGAVIIVEATMHHLGLRGPQRRLSRTEMDAEVLQSASRIRTSAAFGEIIILIVYLPMLVLVGVDGKMFKPMAQTVMFAISGAFMLSLTYVPMMSAALLDRSGRRRENFSERMMQFFQRLYNPVIHVVLRYKSKVVLGTVLVFAGSLLLFSRMGAEFLPTLEEGDLAVETRLMPGSSLTHTVGTVQKMADLLLRAFPDEVREVVGKIGSPEIPTDPMPMEAADVMVLLHPKKQWTKASSQAELAEQMSRVLEALPGVRFGFQQPIQLRFNELMTGVRQDVAVKIFGEDLDQLAALAAQVGRIVEKVAGVRDVYVEEVTGLTQIVVRIDRDAIARYGLSIESVNQTLNMAFAGQSAGLVYEGDRRFDLVVRLGQGSRENLEDVRNLYVVSPSGNQIPMHQLAEISFRVGPNQIQREDTKRRIYVGLNVRGRDVAGVVEEISARIAAGMKLPPGYYITYGGQFENLQKATARLSLAVPAALALIFFLLYFTFRSLKHAVLIFTAIPMSAIGGILALWLRDMPFSISAGVGFIALFGVAVLNGIVLLAEFNRLKREGLSNLHRIVLQGTRIRLRPVLMTASVASLGFLPMALATSAGAEVQKPLATVVIGGLVTATLLTLLVLPCLYIYTEKLKPVRIMRKTIAPLLTGLILLTGALRAQQPVSLEEAISMALSTHPSMKEAALEERYQAQAGKGAVYLGKTDLHLMVGQYNSYSWEDHNFTISQQIPHPRNFSAQRRLAGERIRAAGLQTRWTASELRHEVKQVYYQILYLQARRLLLQELDSIYAAFRRVASLKFSAGESAMIEQATAETEWSENRNRYLRNEADIRAAYMALFQLTGCDQLRVPQPEDLEQRSLQVYPDDSVTASSPRIVWLRQQIAVAEKEQEAVAARRLPDFTLGYFNQSLIREPIDASGDKLATAADRFMGIQAGLAISLFNKPMKAQIAAAETQRELAENRLRLETELLNRQWKQAIEAWKKNRTTVLYYEKTALPNAERLLDLARKGYAEGNTDYAQYLLAIRNAVQLRENYLLSVQELNQAVLQLEYLAGREQQGAP